MKFADFFRKKSSGNVAKDRLKSGLSFRSCELFSGHYGADSERHY